MDSDVSRNGDSEDIDIGFAFNHSSFCDKIIQLEIMKDIIELFPNGNYSSTSTNQTSLGKRRRDDMQKDNGILSPKLFTIMCFLFFHFLTDLSLVIINIDDEAANPTNVADSHMDCSAVLKVRTLRISSAILAEKSMFFYKVCVFSLLFRFEYFW